MMLQRRRFLLLSGAAVAAGPLAACTGVDKVPVAGVPRSGFDGKSTAEEVTAEINRARGYLEGCVRKT